MGCGSPPLCLKDLQEVWWTVPPELSSIPPGIEMENCFRQSAPRFEEADREGLPLRLEETVRLMASSDKEVLVIVAHAGLIGSLTTHLGLVDAFDGEPGWGLRNAEVRVA